MTIILSSKFKEPSRAKQQLIFDKSKITSLKADRVLNFSHNKILSQLATRSFTRNRTQKAYNFTCIFNVENNQKKKGDQRTSCI
jgi:hypothetical protein